jgi:hypothetical protein
VSRSTAAVIDALCSQSPAACQRWWPPRRAIGSHWQSRWPVQVTTVERKAQAAVEAARAAEASAASAKAALARAHDGWEELCHLGSKPPPRPKPLG